MADPYDPHCGTAPRIPGYEDGYPNVNGAAETPSDSLDLDPMLFPHRKEPVQIPPYAFGESIEAYQGRQQAAMEAKERQDYWDGRCFQLDADVAMGANLTPKKE